MPNFAGVGLALQGANAAQADTMNLRTQQLGLEDLERTTAVNQDVRNVAAAGGTHEDMARAAETRGDYARAEEHRRHGKALEEESIKSVVHRALIDPTPGNRPDLVEEANRYGKGKGMTSMTLDEKGNLSFVGSKSGTMNIGLAAERMGLVKPFEHVLPAGSTYVRNNPVSGTTTSFTAPPAEKYAATRTGTIYDQATGDVKYTPPDDNWALGEITHGDKKVPVSFNKKTGEAVVLGPGGHPEKAQVHTSPDGRTTVAIGSQVFELTPGTPGTPGSSGFLGFGGRPATPATPSTLTPVAAPGAAASAPPVEGARQAPDGKWYVKQGAGWAEVVVNGGAPAGGPAATPAATPASAPAPAPKATPKPKQAATPVKAEEDKLPEVVTPSAAPSPAAKQQSRNAAARAEQDKAREAAPKKRAVEAFRAIASSPRMTADDAPLIQEAIDTGLLTPAEKAKGERMLAKLKPQTASYARGGKVQRYGL